VIAVGQIVTIRARMLVTGAWAAAMVPPSPANGPLPDDAVVRESLGKAAEAAYIQQSRREAMELLKR